MYMTEELIGYGEVEYKKKKALGLGLKKLYKLSNEGSQEQLQSLLNKFRTIRKESSFVSKALAVAKANPVLTALGAVGTASAGSSLGLSAYGSYLSKKKAEENSRKIRTGLIGAGGLAAGALLGNSVLSHLKDRSKDNFESRIASKARELQTEIMADHAARYSPYGGIAGYNSAEDYGRITPEQKARLMRLYEQAYK